MDLILIDTNKYLDFYKSEKIAKLMPQLTKLRKHVVVTRQIVDEVNRRKADVVLDAIRQNMKTESWKIPENLLPEVEGTVRLRDDISKQNQAMEALKRRVKKVMEDLALNVALSQDHISKELEGFWNQPLKESTVQFERASRRKAVGNPPGKHSDPIGDELTWEQFLDAAKGLRAAWIVSADNDYFVTIGGKKHLNPKLYQELRVVSPEIVVYCFDVLADAVKEFAVRNPEKENEVLSETDLNQIAEAEREMDRSAYFGADSLKPTVCPRCKAENSFLGGGAYLRSQYGGLTLQYVCGKCGFHLDTGDSWD